jgi:hypothetical protein
LAALRKLIPSRGIKLATLLTPAKVSAVYVELIERWKGSKPRMNAAHDVRVALLDPSVLTFSEESLMEF